MHRLAAVLIACACMGLAPAARGQSASITVAPIPATTAGHVVTLGWTVTNTGASARSFGVGAEIRRADMVLADLGGQTTPVLAPGASASGTFGYTTPTWWRAGPTIARAAVWTGSAGSSTWLGNFDREFSVEPPAVPLEGRLVYHAYSAYLASPVGPNDGHVFIASLPAGPLRKVTAGLPVENAVNPHFSPDGSQVTFTAIPQGVVPPGAPRDYGSLGPYLEIYVHDLARGVLTRLTHNTVPDEDGKFSPDGRTIVFKRSGQIWAMNADGSGAAPLTSGGREKSGPGYAPDGASIVYWAGDGSQADIWRMSASGAGATQLVGTPGLQEFYPVYRDAGTILYARWESTSDRHDKLYAYTVASGTTQRLPLNLTGVEDADPFPVDADRIGFSSTRMGGSYDLYVGDPATGTVVAIGPTDDVLQELGGWYSPYPFARSLAMVSPGAGAQLMAGNMAVASVRAYSEGGVWAGAAPRMILQGPGTADSTALRDDGLDGDATAGDGLYSARLTLPAQVGSYAALAEALSVEGGITRLLRSPAVGVTLVEPLPAPVAQAATNVTGTGFTAHWSPVGGATGYRLDVSTGSVFADYLVGHQDLDVGDVTSREVSIPGGGSYYYRVRAYNAVGTGPSSNTVAVTSVTSVARIESQPPESYRLHRARPNPSRPATAIEFELPRSGFTTFSLFSALGVHVATLVEGELPAGRYRVHWDGARHPTGVYFYRLRSGRFTATGRLVHLR